MAKNRPKPEEIVTKLRRVKVLTRQVMLRLNAIQQIGVTEQTYYLWKKKYGGMARTNWSAYKKRTSDYAKPFLI